MGFSGQFVFGRSDGPLLDAPAFDTVRPPWGDGADEMRPRPGGWQTLELKHDRYEVNAELLRSLVESTGSPACVALIYDSDVAEVVGLAPDGREWRAVLHLHVAAALAVTRPDGVDDDLVWIESPEYREAVVHARRELDAAVPGNAEGAIAWAAAAGFTAGGGPAAVEELLRSRRVFVEELFFDLLDALGFPPLRRT